jgi:anti-sigma factor RsiW
MNCKNVEPLLPLYAGGDLKQEPSRSVASHLRYCTECTRVVDEYAAANQLLQRYEPPVFSDEIYGGIRTQVLHEIERTSNRTESPGIFSWLLLPLVQPRLRWITAALLLAISVIALYSSRNPSYQPRNHQEVADGTAEPVPVDNGAGVRSKNSNEAAGASWSANKGQVRIAITRDRIIEKRRANGGVVATNLAGVIGVSQPSSAPAPVRVEMQTNDRNIRIIWLSGPRPGADGSDGSKGL